MLSSRTTPLQLLLINQPLETELPPLVTNPHPFTPESELIGRDCAAMEPEVQQLRDQKAEQQTQVATFALIFKMSMHSFKK